MRGYILSITLLIAASCSTLPTYSPDTRIRVVEVVDRVKCEIKDTVKQFGRPPLNLGNAAVGFTMTLRVETEIGPTASVDWIIPYHLTDTFTFGGTAGMTNSAMREGSFKYLFKASELMNYRCKNHSHDVELGSFGIKEWVEKIAIAAKETHSDQPSGFDYTAKFGVAANASGKPGFKIINLSGSLGLAGKRTDTHTLVVGFLKAADKKFVDSIELQRLDQQLDLLRLRDSLRP
jgi:hypothetical protein